MPPVVVAFFVLIGLGGGLALTDDLAPIYAGIDHTKRLKTEKTPITYNVWTAPRWNAEADEKKGCDVTIFALVGGRGSTRLRYGGVEQILDNSWTFDERIDHGTRVSVRLEFVDPIGGWTLAERKVSFTCRRKAMRDW